MINVLVLLVCILVFIIYLQIKIVVNKKKENKSSMHRIKSFVNR